MQVDGEPCRLKPSVISIKLRNRAKMLMKQKRINGSQLSSLKDTSLNTNRMRLQVSRIGLTDYETYHYDKEKLKEISVPLGIIIVLRDADLESVREQINRLSKDMLVTTSNLSSNGSQSTVGGAPARSSTSTESLTPPSIQPLSPKWCFLDSTTAVRFFRVDQGQEHLHYITDISSEDLYILDPELTTTPAKTLNSISTDSESELSNTITYQASSSIIDDYKYPVTPPRSPFTETEGQVSPADKALVDSAKRGDMKRFVDAHLKGANILQTDGDGMSVLHNAARFNYKDIVQYIVVNGPPEIIDMLDKEKGQTALHKAAWYQRRTICRMLVQAGSNLLIQDKQGNTPKAQALRAEDLELANFLEYQELLQQTQASSTQV